VGGPRGKVSGRQRHRGGGGEFSKKLSNSPTFGEGVQPYPITHIPDIVPISLLQRKGFQQFGSKGLPSDIKSDNINKIRL